MGYRSEGKIWLDEEAQKLLPKELKDDLDSDWTKEVETGVWSFSDWKWYTSYKIVGMWEDFLRELADKGMEEHYDFARCGEEYEDNEIVTYNKFSLSRTIEVY